MALSGLAKMEDEKIVLNVMWGYRDGQGRWQPCANLKMTAGEQWKHNKESGFDMGPIPFCSIPIAWV